MGTAAILFGGIAREFSFVKVVEARRDGVPSTSSLSLARIMRVITSHKRRPIMRRGVGNILSSACGSW